MKYVTQDICRHARLQLLCEREKCYLDSYVRIHSYWYIISYKNYVPQFKIGRLDGFLYWPVFTKHVSVKKVTSPLWSSSGGQLFPVSKTRLNLILMANWWLFSPINFVRQTIDQKLRYKIKVMSSFATSRTWWKSFTHKEGRWEIFFESVPTNT
jgi:hypothetical protein